MNIIDLTELGSPALSTCTLPYSVFKISLVVSTMRFFHGATILAAYTFFLIGVDAGIKPLYLLGLITFVIYLHEFAKRSVPFDSF
jgi:hypothetical protein